MINMDGKRQEERPTVHGDMDPLGLETMMWRLEGIVWDAFVIRLGGIGMEVPILSFGVAPPSSGHI
jgi:hypothetical protein